MIIDGNMGCFTVLATSISYPSAKIEVQGQYLEAANENNLDDARTPVTMWVGGVTPSLKSALFPQLGGDGNSEKNTEEEQ